MLPDRAQVGQAFLPATQRTGREACPYFHRTRYTHRRIALRMKETGVKAGMDAVPQRQARPGTAGHFRRIE